MFLSAPSFGKGLGLDIHIRTTIRHDYSFIETAAIRIGGGANAEDSVLEVSAWGSHFLNGVENAALPAMLGPFHVHYESIDDNTHHYTIEVGEYQSILLKSFKDFVSIKFTMAIHENFHDSIGLLGDFQHGQRLARDGVTVIEDINEFGQEWQVHPDEPQLFQATQCILPELTATGDRRRLQASKISKEEAEKACANAPADFKAACIYDVMATGDIEMAQMGF